MKQSFDWLRLVDVERGRGHLGTEMPVAVYRLMQFTLHDELSERFGPEVADEIIRAAGYRAGLAFSQNVLDKTEGFSAFVAELQKKLSEWRIGILRIESADLDSLRLVLTVSEDLDCSGLPVLGDTVCAYDEGFISAILADFTGKEFDVQEIDCWATGDRTCRFTANAR